MPTTKSSALRTHAQRVLAHQAKQAAEEGGPNGRDHDDDAADVLMPDPAFEWGLSSGLTIKKRVTIPVLGFPPGSAIVCRFLEAIHESTVEDSRYPGPASVCQIEAINGEVRILVTGTVLREALARDYPEDDYVGRWFHVVKLPARPDKKYADYAITEIESPNAEPAQASLSV